MFCIVPHTLCDYPSFSSAAAGASPVLGLSRRHVIMQMSVSAPILTSCCLHRRAAATFTFQIFTLWW